MKFPTVLKTMRAGGSVTIERLHYLDFKSKTFRIWEGFGPLSTPETGETWEGQGKVVKVEGGNVASGVTASNMKIGIAFDRESLPDPIIKAVLNSQEEVYGRRYFAALQFFDEAMQPIDRYYPYFVGVMDRVEYNATASTKEVTLNIETPFVRKNNSRVTYFSDTDFKRRAPDDDFMSRISKLVTKTISWPKP